MRVGGGATGDGSSIGGPGGQRRGGGAFGNSVKGVYGGGSVSGGDGVVAEAIELGNRAKPIDTALVVRRMEAIKQKARERA